MILPFAMPRLPYLTIGLVIAFIAAAGVAQMNHLTAKRYQAELATCSQESVRFIEAAKGSEDTIVKLRASNSALVKAMGEQEGRLIAAGAALMQFQNTMRVQREKLRTLEEADRATPKCQLVLNTDLGSSCPAIADGVRKRANRRLPGQAG